MKKSTEVIAVWGKPRNRDDTPSIEVHFNFWRLAGEVSGVFGKKRQDLLEVGIWIDSPTKVESISIFMPFNFTQSDVIDLGHRLANETISQAIFNIALSNIDKDTKSRWVDLRQTDSHFCRVAQFSVTENVIDEADMRVDDVDGGSVITLLSSAIERTSEDIPSLVPIYFRFRLNLPSDTATFVDVVRPIDRAFQSGFDVVEVVNFRVNEARTMSQKVEQRMRTETVADGHVAIRKLVFLTAVPVVSGVSVSHPAAYKARLLEEDIWSPYVPGGMPKGMMVYHWRRPENDPVAGEHAPAVDEFTALVKLQTRRSGLKALAVYTGIAFLLGLFGNLAASAIDRTWINPPKVEENLLRGDSSGNAASSLPPSKDEEAYGSKFDRKSVEANKANETPTDFTIKANEAQHD